MNKARHKRSKMGCLPGDLPKSKKIRMLEGEDTPPAKTYRKDFQKKANRKFRHDSNKEIKDQS
jgi:hypothetical protein